MDSLNHADYRNVKITKKGVVNGSCKISSDSWCLFSGSTNLMKIGLAWYNASPKVARAISIEASYPDMALDGDWSGIRDSEPENIEAMLELAETWFKKKFPNKDWPWVEAMKKGN